MQHLTGIGGPDLRGVGPGPGLDQDPGLALGLGLDLQKEGVNTYGRKVQRIGRWLQI